MVCFALSSSGGRNSCIMKQKSGEKPHGRGNNFSQAMLLVTMIMITNCRKVMMILMIRFESGPRCEAVSHHREAFCYTRRKSCCSNPPPRRESSSHYHRRHRISWNRQICHCWVVVVHQLLSFNVDNVLLKHPPLDNVWAERKKYQLTQIWFSGSEEDCGKVKVLSERKDPQYMLH